MKKTNKLFILIMMMILSISFVGLTKKVEASSDLQVMKSSTGSDLTYRNSTEKVYGLAEYDYPTAEYRAVWVSTFAGDMSAYSSKSSFISEATTILDNMVAMGMNALVFHVRTHNNAFYNSELNPLSKYLANVNFDEFDPVEWLITECHNRGIEFHAWMNPYRVNDSYIVGDYPEGHPCNDSSLILTNSSGSKILDPASTVVQNFIVDTCMEFLEKYDADAIHFDDYFYISGVATNLSDDEKRGNVNAFIYKLQNRMYEMNIEEGRAVQLGISPSGIYRNGGYVKTPTYSSNGSLSAPLYSNTNGFAHYGSYLYSDTKYWIDQEWIDYITPQTYWAMERTGANFYELSKWWSWCVKNKMTNLYLGVGIYQTLENDSYWNRNENEVQNQILNASMYDEVNGFCFYKYSSLLQTSNTIIKNGVDLISNDYWNKRVPGVVIQRYADTIPSVKVTNLINSGSTLSWTSVDNVFGYMVYEVPKGTTLDTNNIDHLKVYTQDTSVTGVNTIKYDYYVSSVNRANVVSTPTKLGEVQLQDYEIIMALINDLPTDITLDDQETVQSVQTAYNALSTENKAKVTNINVLTNAINKINTLNTLKTKLDSFIKTLDKDVTTDRILPTEENMKWSYVNASDADIYNITTGKRLKNYLNNYKIDLYLEISEDDVTYKEVVKVNVGLLKSTQTALFYRNDPSSMSEDHVGQYTGTTSYIGWSNTTLTIGNKVLYIASNNYFELTSDNITSCKWTSCGGVYVNKTENELTIPLSSTFATASPTYGYLVIGSNNQIKTVGTDSSESVSVTILPNETLYIIRYLDRMINSNPFTDLSSISTGTTAYITNYSNIEITQKEEGEKVVALINTIPSTITLSDEALINSINQSYKALSEEAKSYVTNFDKLNSALSKIKELKQELTTAIEDGINELLHYVNLNDYSSSNQKLIDGYLQNAESTISKASSIQEVEKIVKNTKSKIDALKTLTQELNDVKTSAISQLKSYVDLTTLNETLALSVQDVLETYINKVNEATSSSEVSNYVDSYQEEVDLLIIDDYAKQEKEKLEATVNYEIFDEKQKQEIKQELETITSNLTSTTTKEDVDDKVTKAKKSIDDLTKSVEELNNAKADLLAYIDEFDYQDLSSTKVEKIEKLFKDKKVEIDKATSLEELNTIRSSIDEEYQAIIDTEDPTPVQNTNCFTSVLSLRIISTIITIGAVMLILKKKH